MFVEARLDGTSKEPFHCCHFDTVDFHFISVVRLVGVWYAFSATVCWQRKCITYGTHGPLCRECCRRYFFIFTLEDKTHIRNIHVDPAVCTQQLHNIQEMLCSSVVVRCHSLSSERRDDVNRFHVCSFFFFFLFPSFLSITMMHLGRFYRLINFSL